MFKCQLGNNRNELKRRFPKFEQFLTHRGYFDYSTTVFGVGTAHEFLLIAAISFCFIWLGAYQWWFAAFSGYSIHLIVHLAQWAIYRKYIPVIIITFLTLPYCVYAFVEFVKVSILSPSQMFLWAKLPIIEAFSAIQNSVCQSISTVITERGVTEWPSISYRLLPLRYHSRNRLTIW